jgi:hypothetical protein
MTPRRRHRPPPPRLRPHPAPASDPAAVIVPASDHAVDPVADSAAAILAIISASDPAAADGLVIVHAAVVTCP